jgi:ribosomal protein S18 acetylase RimI-like enzyme
MQPFFQLASAANTGTLIELMRELYAHDRSSFEEQRARSALQLILANDSYGRVYLMCINAAIIGYLVVTFGFSLEYGGRDAFVDELYIQKEYRGQGIGKKALQFAEEICREQGIQALHLEVEHENTNEYF